MLRGRSIHIGVNTFLPAGYPRVPGTLRAAERDARAMKRLAAREGLEATLFVGQDATRIAVEAAIESASRELRAGDLCVITFAGHGRRYPDLMVGDPAPRPAGGDNLGIDDEVDGLDDAWCLWDGVLLDDRINALLAGFAAGVRVYVVSDSCFSGTILRLDAQSARPAAPERTAPAIRASVLLHASCEEEARTIEDGQHGYFTKALLEVWSEGAFDGSHTTFFELLKTKRPGAAEFRVGPRDAAFEAGRPFTVAPQARFTPPLKVHLCWLSDPADDPSGREVAREIFEFLSRPVSADGAGDDPVLRPGLGVPVEFGRDLDGLITALERPAYDRAAEPAVGARLVVLILDRPAFASAASRNLVRRAVRRWVGPDATARPERLLPIVLDARWTGELGGVAGMIAGLVVKPRGADRRWKVPSDVAIVAGRLLLRTLGDAQPPRPRVFISHTKADGEARAEELAHYMRGDTRVDVWYDVTDVDRGDELVAQLDKAAGHGVVLVVRTDRYSDSPWCGLELLRAKQDRVPMVTLLDSLDGEPAPSAYGGNHRTMTWRTGREAEVVGRCVQAWLHGHHFVARARAALIHAGLPGNAELLARRPELLDLAQRRPGGDGSKLLVYPDPPMAEAESTLLRSARPDLRITTPSTMLGRVTMVADPQPPLAGCTLALSLSTAEDLPRLDDARRGSGLTSAHLDDALYAIVLATLNAGAQIAYGGDFRSAATQGYAARLSDLHRARRRLGTGTQSQLVAFVQPGVGRDGDAEVDFWPVEVPGLPADDVEVRRILWTMAMRDEMTTRSDGRVVLGGQAQPMLEQGAPGYRGPWPGVLEECWRIADANKGLYIIGAFGGFAGVLARMLEDGQVPSEFLAATYAGTRVSQLGERVDAARRALFEQARARVLLATPDGALRGADQMARDLLARWQRFCDGDPDSWPNGLSVSENRRLLRSTDPTEISQLVFTGLHRRRPRSSKTIQIALYHGDIATVTDVDGYAVTSTPRLQHVGALGALDRHMSGRLSRQSATSLEPVVAVPVETDGLAGRQVLVAKLDVPEAGQLVTKEIVERLARQVASACAKAELGSIAISPFGTTMGLGTVESVRAMLDGFTAEAPPTLRTIVLCEVDPDRYAALKVAVDGRPEVRELRVGPGRPMTDAALVINAEAFPVADGVGLRTTLYDTDRQQAVVRVIEGHVPAGQWAWLHSRPATFATTTTISDVFREHLLRDDGFAALRAAAGRRIVLLTNDLASSLPWEFLAVSRDQIPALRSGLTRRAVMTGDVQPPADRASTDGRLRVLLVINPREDLAGAEDEGAAVEAVLRRHRDVDLTIVRGRDATVPAVQQALRQGHFDVMHYAGHAHYAAADPAASGLLLADATFTSAHLRDVPVPRLVVLGGCESARLRTSAAAPAAPEGNARIPGAEQPLAAAILRAGVVALVGTFYPVGDQAALAFTTALYTALVEGRPIGEGVVEARSALYERKQLDWGNFLLYGDDRLIV